MPDRRPDLRAALCRACSGHDSDGAGGVAGPPAARELQPAGAVRPLLVAPVSAPGRDQGPVCDWLTAVPAARNRRSVVNGAWLTGARPRAWKVFWMRRHSTCRLCVAAACLAAVCGITVPGVAGAVPAAQVPGRPLAQPARLLAVSGSALPGTAPGARLWVGRYSGAGNGEDEGLSVAVSPDGARVFVTGMSWGGTSGYDYATVAYSAATGARLWAQRYNGPGNRDDGAGSVAVSPGGTRVFVTGTSPGAGSGSDYATVAYSAATGTRLWVRRYNGPGNGEDHASSVAVSPGGTRVFVTGSSQGARSVFALDYATVAYNAATGTRLWAQRYNGPGNSYDVATSLAVSPCGTRVFVTGISVGRATGFDYATVAYRP
jgi:hypothetical protein